jgi:hypothetical protein
VDAQKCYPLREFAQGFGSNVLIWRAINDGFPEPTYFGQ